MVVVDEVLHADQENVYSPRPFHREVLRIVPGKMDTHSILENLRQKNLIYLLNLITIISRILATMKLVFFIDSVNILSDYTENDSSYDTTLSQTKWAFQDNYVCAVSLSLLLEKSTQKTSDQPLLPLKLALNSSRLATGSTMSASGSVCARVIGPRLRSTR